MALSDSVPELSIIIPTFRREEQLRECIQSALALEGIRFEVFVVDDSPEGSARAVVEAIQDPRVSYRKRDIPTGGRPAVVRNEAARAARGSLLYFLDDDDRTIAANLKQACALLTVSSAGVLVSMPRPFGAVPERVQEEIHYFEKTQAFLDRWHSSKFTMVSRMLFSASPLVCSTCVIKASVFASVGGFDEAMPLFEDVEFYQRAIRGWGFVFQSEPILERRVGEVSLISTSTTDRVMQSYRIAHDKYRTRHGTAEFWALKVWNKLRSRITPE